MGTEAPMKAIVLFCCAVAVGAAAASVYAPQHMGAAIVVAVAMLVCALVVAMMAVQPPKEIEDARLAGLAGALTRLPPMLTSSERAHGTRPRSWLSWNIPSSN